MAEAKSNAGAMPGEDLLLDYASGALPEPVSVLVATMLALRPDLRQRVSEMEAVGGYLLEEIEPADLSNDAFDAVLARIEAPGMPDEASANNDNATPSDAATVAAVPEPLRSYLGSPLSKLAWRKRGPGIEEVRLPVADKRFEMSVLRLGPGRSVPTHSHEGSELTLVLDGAFSDAAGRYARGDLAVNGEEDQHAPMADPEDGCLCLAITGGPLRFSNPLIQLYDRMTRG
ncbi:ChrR family anti-sigma-E factor [Nisaea nitritireducens]|uniref:ChrR family anti-sigma-E factor n=1 Tax=Nisaea nitritireducens TaxID=568392 RepID=UPI001868E3B4|nr:ChrR family anti-sigma-E factor [Nisaea nitritireducens]